MKKNKPYLPTTTLLCLLLTMAFPACKKPPSKTKAQVIQERLNQRLERWRKGMQRNCKNKIMETASAIADSTLLSNARLQRDTSGIPSIPPRPKLPDFTPPKDTTPVKPIFHNGQ
ncbi:MAG TPA: hypothetical protein ENJ20_07540 [Bacteroidetes bacterium]|nr:hypothetical protein [Bacteroidota bacterium]